MIYTYICISSMCLMFMLYVICLTRNILTELVRLYKPSRINTIHFFYVPIYEQRVAESGHIFHCMMCQQWDIGTDSPPLLRYANIGMNSWKMRLREIYKAIRHLLQSPARFLVPFGPAGTRGPVGNVHISYQ